ncbi:MAG: DUF4301 family protein [Candidatus Eisenbacteria bacterium]|nr:DUF4301 family protein [Candidatus Eisenbacteria bacterium]
MEDLRFDDRDLERLRRHGVAPEEAARQYELLRNPPGYARLDRACRPGDGIRILGQEETEEALAAYERARAANRFSKFVPASGAATRMFRALQWFRNEPRDLSRRDVEEAASKGEDRATGLLRFLDALPRFAFFEDLRVHLARSGGGDAESLAAAFLYRPVLDALLAPEAMGYASLPKGLIPFHKYGDGPRTAFEEHLVEAALYARGADAGVRLHFTISPDQETRFREVLDRACPKGEREGTRYRVGFSAQKPSTDTIAVDFEDRIFRDGDGSILFRPGGHGALIENLNELHGDLVFIKNIDNVSPAQNGGEAVRSKKTLAGLLVLLQEKIHAHLEVLAGGAEGEELEGIAAFARTTLHLETDGIARRGAGALREFLLRRLDRPIRVCGMVRNQGDPGGGPFWVRGANGFVTPQIVETSQIDRGSPEQMEILRSATHFNPVDLVCGARNHRGEPHDLTRFIDPSAVFISRKSKDGKELKALERPGLWNGAMAGWITVFVEVPSHTFTPVKQVTDLLKPEHQAG